MQHLQFILPQSFSTIFYYFFSIPVVAINVIYTHLLFLPLSPLSTKVPVLLGHLVSVILLSQKKQKW